MANESVTQDPRFSSYELLVCQAKALMRELWHEEFETRPDLRIVGETDEARASSDEVKECRLLALLEKEFGPVEGARPKLVLVQGGLQA